MKFRKNKKKADPNRQIITEPPRKSILDVVETNLKIANRVTFLHRILYIGQYNFKDDLSIVAAMEANYKQSNSGYITEPLSGILLYYQHYFCYIVEAPERVLNKHLSLLFDQFGEYLSNVKLLSAVHHIKGRFYDEWLSYYGRPPERVEEIDPNSDLEQSMWYVKDCCEKLYNFANAFLADFHNEEEKKEVEEEGNASIGEEPKVRRRTGLVERDIYSEYLPELKLLDFLVNCKHLKDLKQYHKYYEYVGQSMDFSRKAWPAPTTMIPYNVFEVPYDPVEDLPMVKEPIKGEKDVYDTLSTVESIEGTMTGSYIGSIAAMSAVVKYD